MADTESRPAKRTKTSHNDKPNKNKAKYRGQKPRDSNEASTTQNRKGGRQLTFSASGIHSGDVGIFVTSDKGQEKKCLQELSDLLGEYFEDDKSVEATSSDAGANGGDVDIEADINAELASLRPQAANTNAQAQKLTLVTLDIPCVSFVRFPTKSDADPVEIVHRLCQSANDKDSTGPRSRYVKRLTPVTLIRKTLSGGLETLCSEVLPKHFQMDTSTVANRSSSPGTADSILPCKFAIRPTVRNNNKMNRDEIIQLVADKIASLGQGKHSVDLKGYNKLVLVDVYRNVVGMSVVSNEYEVLKRFNLAEIHASHFEYESQTDQNGVSGV